LKNYYGTRRNMENTSFPLIQFENKDLKKFIKENWQEFLLDKDFCDLTIVCEDKKILAHKVLVSSSSSVLKNILNVNADPHSTIFLTGVKFCHLQILIQFIYHGEVVIAKEDLLCILKLAENLKIKGLSDKILSNNDENIKIPKKGNDDNCYTNNKMEMSTSIENENMKSVLNKEEHANNTDIISILNKMEQYSCDKCDKYYTRMSSLDRHKKSAHEGIRYPCTKCDPNNTVYFTNLQGLRGHESSVHEGIRFPCDKCDYKASQMSTLKKHKDSIHEKIQNYFYCNLCNFKTVKKSYLKNHIESLHNNLTLE